MTVTDTQKIGALLDAMYEMVSGPAGPRDWSRQQDIFHPDCRQIRTGQDDAGQSWHKMFDPEQYRTEATAVFAERGFYEVEVAREIKVFGNIAHAWSSYEAKINPDDTVPERRGINSIQLYRGGPFGWRVISMLWDNEREGLSIEDSFAAA